MAVISIL